MRCGTAGLVGADVLNQSLILRAVSHSLQDGSGLSIHRVDELSLLVVKLNVLCPECALLTVSGVVNVDTGDRPISPIAHGLPVSTRLVSPEVATAPLPHNRCAIKIGNEIEFAIGINSHPGIGLNWLLGKAETQEH